LEMGEFETRLEMAHRAQSAEQLRLILADLPRPRLSPWGTRLRIHAWLQTRWPLQELTRLRLHPLPTSFRARLFPRTGSRIIP